MSTPNQSGKSSRPNADEQRKPNQPQYQPVEQADDEESALTQRQSKQTNPADQTPQGVQASGEGQEDDLDEEEWMDEEGDDLSPEELQAEEDSNETSGGRQPGKRKGLRGGDSPRP